MRKAALPTDTDAYRRTACRYCEAELSPSFLDFGMMPLANSFIRENQVDESEFVCDLSLCWCANCTLVQLSHVVPPKVMFDQYLYVSSTTQTFQKHFADYARQVREKLRHVEKALAVDIGSNDGLLLACYEQEGLRAIGVEPAENLSDLANRNGRKTMNSFFNSECVEEILATYGPAHVVSANNVFAHMDESKKVCENVVRLLVRDGLFVLEFPYLLTMIEGLLFDMIYHEHLSYPSVHALHYLFQRFDLKIFDIDFVPSHGGSLRVFVERNDGPYPTSDRVAAYLDRERVNGYLSFDTYQRFADRVNGARKEIPKYLYRIISSGKTIAGYGAAAKANTLLCACGLTNSDIKYIVDDNPLKQDYLTPGTKIPIVSSSHFDSDPSDYIVIFAWNFAPEIMKKLAHLRKQGVQFIIPLPTPRFV